MNGKCGTCNESHEAFVRQMPDGSSHVFQSPEQLARRNAATIAAKERVSTEWRRVTGR